MAVPRYRLALLLVRLGAGHSQRGGAEPVELGQRRLWLQAALGSVVVLALAARIGWNLNGEAALESGALQFPLTLGMGVAVFVALPWWQFQLQHGQWRASYPELFERARQNGLTLARRRCSPG